MTITGYTVSELIKKSGKSRSAVESFISRHEIEPIIGELLYPPSTLDLLINTKRGRPSKKPKDTKPTEIPKKPRKTSKNESI
jgi:hypothetical protein